MEPRIQYAKTSDGVTIAYWKMGEGPPLVVPSNLVASHLQMEWQVPGAASSMSISPAARRWSATTVADGNVRIATLLDFSQDAAILDLEAVISRLALSGSH
jgi:hypothetical protein